MKLGILTSSRADFGIYRPLLNALAGDQRFQTEIIAFGTHLSPYHGHTLHQIQSEFNGTIHQVEGMSQSDSPTAIALAYGTVHNQFASFWSAHSFDVILALGDRYEMAAAVNAGIPHGIHFAHLHGGETTEGAIDNIYRHQISLASHYHFTSTDLFSERVEQLLGSNRNTYTVGALSLDGIDSLNLPNWSQVANEFEIPFSSFVLTTFHPETGNSANTQDHIEQLRLALPPILDKINMVVTMPNADTLGSMYRTLWEQIAAEFPDQISLIENFGRTNYFSAVKQSSGLFGNTSSGIIEAASLGKKVVNVGDRQAGRPRSENTTDVSFNSSEMVNSVLSMIQSPDYSGENVYSKPNTAQLILNELYAAL